MSQLLCEERVISDRMLSNMKSAAQSPSDEEEKSTFILLKAICVVLYILTTIT